MFKKLFKFVQIFEIFYIEDFKNFMPNLKSTLRIVGVKEKEMSTTDKHFKYEKKEKQRKRMAD